MNNQFDELAKDLAQSSTRRAAVKKFGLGIAAIALVCGSAVAQQFSAWSAPVNMGPSINTVYNEWHAAISADGLTIFFISNRPGGFGGSDLWVAQRPHRDANWGPAQNLGARINTSADEFTPALSPDGHWLFYSSLGLENKNTLQIYAAFRCDTSDTLGWGVPVNLGKGVNENHYNGDPSLFIDPQTGVVTLYSARLDKAGQGDWNIYQSIQGADGTFGDAVPVAELESPDRETRPSVRRDGLEILFTSDRPGSFGAVDVWGSTRPTTSDAWSAPVNLGPAVNTEFNDRAPYLSDDGLNLILISDRPGGFGGNDLYMSTRKKIE